jgi:type IV pilus assembly protein PilF
MNAVSSTSRSILVLVLLSVLSACAGGGGGNTSNDDAAQANLNLGVAYLRQGRPDLAVENLERALRLNPRFAAAHSAIAIAHDQLGNVEDAEEHYARAVRLQPSDPNIANGYAVFLCRQNRWRDAEPYFRRAVSNPRYPTPAAALTNAGNCAQDAGDTQGAEEYYRQALTQDGSFAGALAGMMEVAYRNENYLQARAFMQRYLDGRPATATVLLLCYNIETQLEDRDAAGRCARRLRDDFPQSPELAQLRQFERDGR